MPDATPPRPLTGCIATCPPGCTDRHALTTPDVVAGLLADARAQLADVQHGAGAWIREAVARETAGLTARLAEVTADRDHLAAKLAETLAANQRWAETLADVQQAGRERDDARSAFAKLAAHFTQGKQSGWTARVSGTVLRRLCAMAMCEPPPGSDAPDEFAELVAEQVALRALVAEMLDHERPSNGLRDEWRQRAGLDAP